MRKGLLGKEGRYKGAIGVGAFKIHCVHTQSG